MDFDPSFDQSLSKKASPFAVAMIPNHVLLCLVGTFISLYHPHKKSQPFDFRPKGQVLLRVDPERYFLIRPSKAGLGAAERVNSSERVLKR